MKIENEIKSKYTAFKAYLDERIQNNSEYSDDNKRQLELNTNSGRNLQDSKKGYYYEHWNASVFDLLSEETYYGYYYGFFITEDKFIYVNQKSVDIDYDDLKIVGIKLVSKITNQDNCIYS